MLDQNIRGIEGRATHGSCLSGDTAYRISCARLGLAWHFDKMQEAKKFRCAVHPQVPPNAERPPGVGTWAFPYEGHNSKGNPISAVQSKNYFFETAQLQLQMDNN